MKIENGEAQVSAASRRLIWCWEIGGGLGHLSRIRSFAAPLAEKGDVVWYALKDVTRTRGLFSNDDVILQAPTWHAQATGLMPPVNYAAVLAHQGWLGAEYLEARVRCWIRLFELSKAQVVMLDYAPTAHLAARCLGLPTLRIGNGFEIPPAQTPYPLFVTQNRDLKELVQLQETVGRVCQEVIKSVASSDIVKTLDLPLEQLLQASADYVVGPPELDHYAENSVGRNGINYIAAERRKSPKPVIENKTMWTDAQRPRVFVYLNPGHSSFDVVLRSLAELNTQVIVYAPGAHMKVLHERYKGNFQFYSEALDLPQILPQANLVICHSAVGTGASSWAFGVPFIAVPSQSEQLMSANRAVQTSAALLMNPQITIPDCASFIRSALNSLQLKQRAQAMRTIIDSLSSAAHRESGTISDAIDRAILKQHCFE
jgi:UDP:flavonoid glycosyltransferase YjiC (YdhE family)